MTLHYHGTPVTPRSSLYELAGRNFCVSFAAPRDVEVCHQIGQSVMLDNGAFSFWRGGRELDWPGYYEWAGPWLDFQTTWAVIPDVIDGSEEDNDRLLVHWFQARMRKGAPVWHLHESLERLRRLAHGYERICFGSSGSYRDVGTAGWHRRVSDAFDVIADCDVWVHMLRGMSQSGGPYPFASVDSTDVAQNHHLPHKSPRLIADRWDGLQCPARWRSVGTQLEAAV